jgi:hypothetical protein
LPYLSAVTITAGTSDIRTSDIRTTGNQTYAGAAVLTYDLTLESTTNGAIALTGGIDGSTGGYKDLTIVTGTASGTVTLGNAASAGTDETMGSLTITASVLTVNPYGDVRPNGLMTVTANVTNNGQITAGPNPSAGLSYDTIYFNRNYTGGISGTLNGNGDTFTRVVFNGETAAVGTFTQNNTVLVLKGASIGSPSTVQKFSQDTSSTLGHIKIENRSGTVQNKVELRSDILQDNDAVLELDNSTVMDLYDSGAGIFRSWSVGGSLAGSQGFYGNHGTLQFNTVGGITAVPVPPPALRCGDLRLQGVSMANRFTVNNAGPATVSAQGNVVIQGAMDAAAPDPDYTIDMSSTYVAFTGDLPQLVLEMTGTGTLQTGQPLGILSVAETAVTTLQNDLSLRGGVAINHRSPTQGVLAAGAWDIAVYAGLEGKRNLGANRHGTNTSVNYARWEVIDHPSVIRNPPPFVTPPSMDALVQDPGGRVVFRRDPNGSVSAANPVFFEILGNTIWRNLDCTERGDSSLSRGPGVLQFSRHPDQHTVLETFTVKVDVPSAAAGSVPPEDYITVTRYDRAPNAASLYKYTYYDTGTGVFVSPVVPAGAEDLPVSPAPGNLKGAVEAEKRKYWNINLVPPSIPGQPILDIQCTNIYFSHAYNQRIPIDTAKMFLKALPFYRSSPSLEGYFNYDWIELRKIIYSFTEDADGNGRIDRIRVQSNTALNGDFSDFEIRVHGYVIDTSRGRRTLLDLPNSGGGFELVSEKTSHPSDQDSFYMYVEEQPFPDGGNTPVWDVIRNTSLRDTITQNSTIGSPDQDQGVQSFDTVPPRISHALTLPGHPQTYVRMSEPVVSQDPRLPPFTGSPRIDPSNPAEAVEIVEQRTFVYEYKPPENSGRQAKDLPVTIPRGNLSYLLRLVTAYGAAELARLPSLNSGGQPAESFTVTGLVDQGVRAMDWHDPAVDPIDWLYYPPPKYPVDWNYSGYAAVFGNGHLRSLGGAYASFAADTPFGEKADGSPIPLAEVFLPPHKLLNTGMIRDLSLGLGIIPSSFPSVNTISRRVTDVLVSLPPLTSRDAGYFAWPVWARYDDSSINPGSEFGGQQLTDTGIIWEFSGQKFLEERDTTLQVRLNPSLAGGVDLFFGIDVPAAVRSPPDLSAKGKGSGGLWLPLPQPPDPHLFSMVPGFGGARIKYGTPAGPSLFNFSFGKTDSGYESGARLDFVLRLADPLYPDQNLFIARLDAPPGQIPFDWYRMVRPFTFDIQDVILQRGGVTILNNVINSLTGENTYIRYRLAKAGRVTIQVFTLDGNLVKVIRREYRDAGEWTDTWNGTNTGGRPVARGMYFVRVVGPGIDEIRKIMVVK